MQLTFSERLRTLIEQRKLSFTAVARGTGVSRQTVYNWLETDRIKKNNLLALAEFLDLSPEWLQYGAGTNTSIQDSEELEPWNEIRQKYINQVVHNEQRLNLAMKASNISIWEYDFVSGMEWSGNNDELFNPSANASPSSLEDFLDKFTKDQRKDYELRLTELISSGGIDHRELRCINASGEELWYDVWSTQQVDSNQNPTGLVGSLQEITQRKHIEQSLRNSEQYNRMLFDESTIGLALCRMDGKLVDINPAYAAILGRSVEETLKLSYWDITPEKYAADEQFQLETLNKTGKYSNYEKEYIHTNGHLVPVQLSGQLLEKNGEMFIWSNVEDITYRKQAEEALKLSQQKYQELFQRANDSIFIADAKSRQFIDVNDNAAERLGYTKDELLLLRIDDIVQPMPEAQFSKIFTTLSNGRAMVFETTHIHKDRSAMPVEISTRMIEMDKQNVIESIVRDISTRKQAEEALKSSERHYRGLFENIPVPIWEEDFSSVKAYLDNLRAEGIIDLQTHLDQHPESSSNCASLVKIIDINKAALTMHNASTKQELLEKLAVIFTPESYEAFNRELLAIWNGEHHATFPAVVKTLTGQVKHITIEWLVTPGHQNTLSRVLVLELPHITEDKAK